MWVGLRFRLRVVESLHEAGLVPKPYPRGLGFRGLGFHVPQWYVIRAQSTSIGTHLGPNCPPFEYLDPQG